MNINNMMQQAKKMQQQMEKAKQELAKKEFTIEKQGVTLVINGQKKIVSVNVNEALVDPEDKEILEDLMIIAFNEAIEIVNQEEEKMMPKAPMGAPF